MNHKQFREALEELGWSQLLFARVSGYDPRTIRRFALGESEVPKIANLFLQCAIKLKRIGRSIPSCEETK